MSKKTISVTGLLLLWNMLMVQANAFAQTKAYNPPAEQWIAQKVDSLITHMTLKEKVLMCSGATEQSAFRGFPAMGIPFVHYTDGPRGPNNGGPATAFPAGIGFGSTWNPDLVYKAAKVMGEEARYSGVSVLLAPSINILRDPINGRFFEYYTEDPLLDSRLAVGFVRGVQSEGVAACLKHYICNNREDNRNFYMSIVDDRTLHEIYLPAFKAAVQQGHLWSIMTSANGINNEFTSDSKKMLRDILKTKWGFDGFVITDWLQTRSTLKAALAGLDISMPGGWDCGFGKPLLESIENDSVPISVIDDKVRRILRIYGRMGLLSARDLKAGATKNTAEHQAVELDVAEQSMVLLKNKDHLLPLDTQKIKQVLIIGPNADKKLCLPGMGGSSGITPPFEVTPLQGITELLGKARVHYISSETLGGFQAIPSTAFQNKDGSKGVQAAYFEKDKDAPVVERKEQGIDFMWEMKSPDPSIDPAKYTKARFRATITAPMDGKYTLRMIVNGIATLYKGSFDGEKLAFADSRQTLRIANATVKLQKGVPYPIAIEYEKEPGDAAIRLEWELPEVSKQKWTQVDKAAAKADAVIFIGGIDHSMDTEGRDRRDMNFPGAQENILNHLATINKRTVAVLINGSPLELGGWLPNIPAVLEAWYPGMESGRAIANILFGKTNPSGRLPFSWPKKLADAPSKLLGTENKDYVYYTDSLMVGYRYYDTKKVVPEFAFGYGLSYTSFKYGKLKASSHGDSVSGDITIKNTGVMAGAEVVQIYVRPLKPSVQRPTHELKWFKKVNIGKAGTEQVRFKLGPECFSYYNVQKGAWQLDPGKYEIQVGSSSEDIHSSVIITVP